MTIKLKTIKGFFWSGVQSWGSQAGSLLTFLVLARLLQPEHFGTVALSNTFLTFCTIFTGQSLNVAIVQRRQIEDSQLNTVFWSQIALGAGLTTLGIYFAPTIAALFGQPELEPVLRCFSLLLLVRSLYLVQRALLTRQLEFRKIAIRALVGIICGGVVGINLALLGFGVWSLVGQQVTFELIGLIAFWGLSHWRPRLQFSWPDLREMAGFGGPILLTNLFKFFSQNIDNILIGYFLGEVALGFYAVAYRVLQVLTQLLVDTANQVLTPVLSKLQQDLPQLRQAFYNVIQYTSIFAIPIFLGVVTLSHELVLVIFGDNWLPSAPIMQVLAFGGIVYLILFFNQSVFVAIGQPVWQLHLEVMGAIVNFIACLIAVRWGLLAVAFAFVLSDSTLIVASIWILKTRVDISVKTYLRQFILPGICSVAMVGSILLTKQALHQVLEAHWLLLIATLIGSVIYLACLRLLRPQFFQQLRDAVRSLTSREEVSHSSKF